MVPSTTSSVSISAFRSAPSIRLCHGVMRARQKGVIAVLFAIMLPLILLLIALAIDLSLMYNRKVEVHGVARAAALAAARQLNGTPAGVTKALEAADDIVEDLTYSYSTKSVEWSSAALRFSSTGLPNTWVDAGTAAGESSKIFFVKVDTAELDQAMSEVTTLFIHVLIPSLATVLLSDTAIAGRTSVDVMPLAICAMSPARIAARQNSASSNNNELVEHGFRRGVGYDLMQLNYGGTSPMSFLVNPVAWPGTNGTEAQTTIENVGGFVCTGSMWMPRVTGEPLNLIEKFPLSELYTHINSRFGIYGNGVCKPEGAPPDKNIKFYLRDSAAPWMTTRPSGQSAVSIVSKGNLMTIADLPYDSSEATGAQASSYGPLWSYAKAVPFSRYVPGKDESPSGYTPFSTAAWPVLYQPGSPTATGYPGSSQGDRPYWATAGTNFQAPAAGKAFSTRNRRVINIPLISCPLPAGATKGDVVAVGRFFLTIPATSSTLHAEFAGLVSESALIGSVEIMQ